MDARDKAFHSVEKELAEERARSLFRITSTMEAAVEALRAFDREHGSAPPPAQARHRAELFAEAAERVWFFVIQRESLGLHTPDEVLESYGVPAEVRRRMGPKPKADPAT
jgi:hypothetical protein